MNFNILSARYRDLDYDLNELDESTKTAVDAVLSGVSEILKMPESLDDIRERISSEAWVGSIPTAVDAGDYEVAYRIRTDSDEPEVLGNDLMNAKIYPAIVEPQGVNSVYTGNPQPLLEQTTIPTGVNLLYAVTGTDVVTQPLTPEELQALFSDGFYAFLDKLDVSRDELENHSAAYYTTRYCKSE